jgi:hypothetical protein
MYMEKMFKCTSCTKDDGRTCHINIDTKDNDTMLPDRCPNGNADLAQWEETTDAFVHHMQIERTAQNKRGGWGL